MSNAEKEKFDNFVATKLSDKQLAKLLVLGRTKRPDRNSINAEVLRDLIDEFGDILLYRYTIQKEA